MALSKEKRAKLRKAGFKVGTVQEFLGLSDAEMMIIDMRIALGKKIRAAREKQQLTQAELAKRIHSSQPRIAKIEAGEEGVTLDLMTKAALAVGMTRKQIAKAIAA
ncbi:MAG: helix-turn-helix transcriptional regulator [Deltaproteobacteria bacterium]|nr:helix-turn-helix transcriptional regulator [Deltaproteobacteria bacterium]